MTPRSEPSLMKRPMAMAWRFVVFQEKSWELPEDELSDSLIFTDGTVMASVTGSSKGFLDKTALLEQWFEVKLRRAHVVSKKGSYMFRTSNPSSPSGESFSTPQSRVERLDTDLFSTGVLGSEFRG